ncbi:hypothetical protein COY07_04915 [Candidatus Peregrinibacteria bacterium CG_4_10_14_0_2_um_filter_43_11]|nr:MAG: hypothetical protein COY07_04915 [Candidatus Peregrinibacteria bacterium CG_4_10_14_0_2_um_filter_43_11]
MLILPAIDIIGGKCVRLTRGDYSTQKIYDADPVRVALEFEKQGADILHVIDLEAAKEGRPMSQNIIPAIRKTISIPMQVGGGIRDFETAVFYLESGIDRIILGSVAVFNPNLIRQLIDRFGSGRIVVSIDILDGKIATKGWCEMSDLSYLDFAKRLKLTGVTQVICTDISCDGTLSSPDVTPFLYLKKLGLEVIAAGGISDLSTIQRLQDFGVDGVIVGKALYEGAIRMEDIVCLRRTNVCSPAEREIILKSGLTKRIIPCMDVDNGRVVKGVQFKNLLDSGDPVDLAKYYSDQGADELIFLDITATVEKRKTLVDLVRRVAKEINIPFCVGGGIRTLSDISTLLQAGADKIAIGSAAVTDSDFVSQAASQFGSQCVVISVDAKRAGDQWKLFIKGGREATSINVLEFVQEMERCGAGELLVNSLDRDGTQDGYDLDLLSAITGRVNIPVIASSGAGSPQDFLEAFTIGNCDAALAATLFHDGILTIPDLKQYLSINSIPIRLQASAAVRQQICNTVSLNQSLYESTQF